MKRELRRISITEALHMDISFETLWEEIVNGVDGIEDYDDDDINVEVDGTDFVVIVTREDV